MSTSEQGDRVKKLLAEVGMEGHLEKMPTDISGGMQKRVGLARALILELKFCCWMNRRPASIL